MTSQRKPFPFYDYYGLVSLLLCHFPFLLVACRIGCFVSGFVNIVSRPCLLWLAFRVPRSSSLENAAILRGFATCCVLVSLLCCEIFVPFPFARCGVSALSLRRNGAALPLSSWFLSVVAAMPLWRNRCVALVARLVFTVPAMLFPLCDGMFSL